MGFDPRGGGTTGTTSGTSSGLIHYVWNGTTYVLAPGQVDDGIRGREFAGGTTAAATTFIGATPRVNDRDVL